MLQRSWLFIKKYLKTIIVIIISFFIIENLLIFLIFIFSPNMCGNHVIKSFISPNHKWQLVLFQRDCGAMSGYSSQISLLKADENISKDFGKGNVYIANGYPQGFSIKWLSNKSVLISTPYKENFKMKTSLKGITFKYRYKAYKKDINTSKTHNKY